MNILQHKILKLLPAGILVAWLATASHGQTTAADAADGFSGKAAEEAASPRPRQSIEYVGPDTYILLDAEGRPQPVLGMRYEEFVEAWKRLRQTDGREVKPRFTIEDLQLVGTVEGEQAELKVDITIRPLVVGPLGIPLGMADAFLIEKPKILVEDAPSSTTPLDKNGNSPDGKKSFVAYDPKAGGHVVWIDGGVERLCRVSMTIACSPVRTGNETSLALNLPRSLVSKVNLELPPRAQNIAASEGVVHTLANAANGNTRVTVEGPRGDFRLTWTTAEKDNDDHAAVLSATGAVGITIDGHSVRSDARLTVRSYGGSFDRVQVRLPPGAQLVESNATDGSEPSTSRYRIRRMPSADQSTAAAASLVSVEFDEKQTGPVEIQLSTEQPVALAGEDTSVELAGFEVIGAVRQFGNIAIAVADDWQLRWENGPYVRQIERGELDETLRAIQSTAAFQYDRQPYSLRVEVVSRPMIVHVAPEHTLRIAADRAELRTLLHYQVPGARVFEFRVRLNGWELTEDLISSNGLVDRDRAVVRRDGVLVLPLSQASSRRAEIEFRLRRSLPAGAGALNLALPVPEADIVAGGDLTVVADANIELVPDVASSRGLSAVPVSRLEQLDVSAEGGEIFSYKTFSAETVFAGRWAVRPREVRTDVFTQFTLDWHTAHAIQEVDYDVRHQPLSEIVVEVPVGWSIVNNQLLLLPQRPNEEAIVASLAIEPETHGRPTQIARAQLAQPRIGKFQVRVNYEFGPASGTSDATSSYLNLPRPTATQMNLHRVETHAADEIAIAALPGRESGWRVEENANATKALTLSTRGENATLPIEVRPRSAVRASTAVVERVWLQTWQAGNTIQDRAAIRFRTNGTSAIVELPPNSIASNIEVMLDGILAETTTEQEGRLIVSLPGSTRQANDQTTAHTLELRYRRAAPAGLVTRLAVTPPQLVGSTGLCDVYWHVVLPGDRHIINVPETLFAVDTLQWLELLFGHDAELSQADLEGWASATSHPGPPTTQNEYVFGGLAPVSMTTIAAPRWLIVLAASGFVLLLTLAWMYLPAARHGWIVMAVATAIGGLAFAFPAQAILAGQASILGLVLAAASLWLWRWSGRRTIVPAVAPAAGSTNMRMRSSLRTDSYYGAPAASVSNRGEKHSTSATPTAPLVIPEVER